MVLFRLFPTKTDTETQRSRKGKMHRVESNCPNSVGKGRKSIGKYFAAIMPQTLWSWGLRKVVIAVAANNEK